MKFVAAPFLRIVGLVISFTILASLLSACGTKDKVFEIGVYLDRANLLPRFEGLKEGMTNLGYIEGKNLRYNVLDSSKMDAQQIPAALKEFAARNYDAYWCLSGAGCQNFQPFMQAAQSGVVAGFVDSVALGLAKSLDRPGYNLTGVDSLNNELTLNRMHWILKMDPSIKNIYLLYDPKNPNQLFQLKNIKDEAAKLGVGLIEAKVSSKEESKQIVLNFKASEAGAILPMGIFPFTAAGADLKTVVEREKLILVGGAVGNLNDGALFTYGANDNLIGRQSAGLLDEVLLGEKPAVLPILMPDKLELILNQKLATKLGKTFPEGMVYTADQIIN